MTTPTVQRAPGTAFARERGRIIATLIRHTGNQDLSGVSQRPGRMPRTVCRRLSLTAAPDEPLDVPEPPFGTPQARDVWLFASPERGCYARRPALAF